MTAPQPARELTEAMADTVRFHALAAKMRRSFTEGHGGWWDARVTARDIRQWDAALRSLPYGRTPDAAGSAGPGAGEETPEAAETILARVRELARSWIITPGETDLTIEDLAESVCGRAILAITGPDETAEASS